MYNFLITLWCMEIGLYWYQMGTNINRTYDLIDYLMVGSETIIASTTMIYIVELDAYVLRAGDEKVFNNFADES